MRYKHDTISFRAALELAPPCKNKNTERTWRPMLEMARDGDTGICLCPCEDCRSGRCRGRCRTCRRRFEGLADLLLDDITTADCEDAASLAQARACQNGTARNERRESKGLIPLVLDGHGAHNSMLDALTWFVDWVVKDRLCPIGDAAVVRQAERASVTTPQASSLTDRQFVELLDWCRAGAPDPALAELVMLMIAQTCWRRGAVLGAKLGWVDPFRQTLKSLQKRGHHDDHPVSDWLPVMIARHVAERGPLDPKPSDPLLYLPPKLVTRPDGTLERVVRPMGSRYLDTLTDEAKTSLPWARALDFRLHMVRHTTAAKVERVSKQAVADYFLEHAPRTKGQRYTMARIDEAADALCAIWGGTHPLAGSEQFRPDR